MCVFNKKLIPLQIDSRPKKSLDLMCRRDMVFKPRYPAKPVLQESGFALNLLIPWDCIFGPSNPNCPAVATREDYS